MGSRVLIVAGAMLAAYGCERISTKYCASHGSDTHNCGFQDAPIDSPPPCMSNADCIGTATPICDVPAGECVECLGSADCTGSNKLCNTTTNTCVGCVAHGDCTSSRVCQADGTCADASTIIYVDGSGGSDSGTCTFSAQCQTISYATGSAALPAGRRIVKLTNTIADNPSLAGDTWTFYADPGITKLVPLATNVATLILGGQSLTVIYDLEIDGQAGQSAVTGMGAALRLYRGTVRNAGKMALDFKSGELDIYRSTIANNPGGGIVTDAMGRFDIENTFITRNGNGTATGGADFGATGPSTNVFMFNTVVDNQGKGDNAAHVGGVGCGAGNSLTMPNNIIARNTNSASLTNNTLPGACDFAGSLVQIDDSGLLFVNDNNGSASNYHLMPGSTAIDTAPDGAPGISIDYDGDHRPTGSGKDYGADEYAP